MLPASAEDRLTLIDGRSVAVRVATPSDADGIRSLFEGLSSDSRAMRFGAARRGLTASEAAEMARASGVSGAGVVAIAGGALDRIVGLARYEHAPGAPDGELAIVVADAWHGLGIGTGLVERLLAEAQTAGLDSLWALVRPDNRAMLTVFRTLGCAAEVRHGRDGTLVRLPVGADDDLDEAAVGRFVRSAATSLEPLMRPRSIAVVGASRNPSSPGGAVVAALTASGYRGPVHLVNIAADSVAGRPAVPSLAALDEPVDLVVVAVPAGEVPGVARQAVAVRARGLVVLSSGFSETGPAGAALEAELMHVVRTGGLRAIGPNCLGMAVSDSAWPLDATFAAEPPRPGRVALASQSGGVAAAALAFCRDRGLGLSGFVSLGNSADVGPEELLSWWETDPRTAVVLLYLERLRQTRRLGRVARRVARTTPIVALKAGRGDSGRRGVSSHTAALAAGEAPTDALFDLAGVVRVDTVEELLEAGELLSSQPLPAGDRVAIVSNAGGSAILAADACEAHGLRVPELSRGLLAELAAAVPSAPGLANPVDLGASAGPGELRRAAESLLGSGEVDALIVVVVPVRGADWREMRRVADTLSTGGRPVVGCLTGGPPASGAGDADGRRVPWLGFPESAARAVSHAVRAGAAARRPADPPSRPAGIDRAAARRALAAADPGEWLAPDAVTALLRAYGIATPRRREAATARAAAAAQAALGGPVAVKLARPVIPHKSDFGGVVLGCASPEEAADAFDATARALEARGQTLAAVSVQEMVPDAPESIVGALLDPVIGPAVLAGTGGVTAEVWADRAVALAPVGPATAAELWTRLRGAPLLDGWRGLPGADRPALADVVERVSWLIADQPLLAELDCNPVRAAVGGGRALVLDAAARRAPAG